jgi:hypothetical protein
MNPVGLLMHFCGGAGISAAAKNGWSPHCGLGHGTAR